MAGKIKADYLILKRREQEEGRRRMEVHTKEHMILNNNATWEINSGAAIQQRGKDARYEAIRAAAAADVDARRAKLAALLQAEQGEYEEQLQALEETPAQRLMRMSVRATELKDKREEERLAFVRHQYERQWRLACDPLREQDSQLIVKATTAARAYQIGEKMRQLEMDESENRAFDDLWERDRLAKLGREEAEASARQQMDSAQKAVLDRQVSELHAYRMSEKDLAEQEAEMLHEQARLEGEEAKLVEAHRADVVGKAHRELLDFNDQKISAQRVAIEAERASDNARLAAVLGKEARQEATEKAARAAMQEETKLFADHMLAQKREIANFEKEQDEVRQRELNKAWDKRLEVWGAEQDARERLMAQVLDERKIQTLTKLDRAHIEKEKSADARRVLEAELARINQMQASKLQQAADTRMQHRALLETQIKEKQFQKAATDFNKVQERQASQRAEAQYQEMLQSQLSKTQSQMSKYTR